MHKSSLTVVGTGIKFFSQMTVETLAYIRKSDKVLYLVNEPALKQWIKNNSRCSESLDDLYFHYSLRAESYRAITQHILTQLVGESHICVALYGHPAVCAKPALEAVIEAKKQGYPAKVLPGISAEDCLFADLLIDPGTYGCQSFEATDFLLYRRLFDPKSHLILWQPDVIGVEGHKVSEDNSGRMLLCECLMKFYPHDHEILIYEAAQYPGLKPRIISVFLRDLLKIPLSPISTLYIKPLCQSGYDYEYAKRLKIIKCDLYE